ncbi:proliferating cell nuclear antigen, N-terminal domain-containing protein [Flagelloscypha sp. PMI_526]|nr:proliferating cell nuclear antigen, N-terminal domain-containing protein [Flagelloscypha sp. PMI_526]
MFEAKLQEASMFKKLLDSVKELVTDANFQCEEEGINLQAMDNSHVALVSVKLKRSGFAKYRCDRAVPLGMNLGSLTKVMKCAKDDDTVQLHATDEADVLNLTFEARSADRISQYDLKLMDIDSETLGIPDTEYEAIVTMPSAEFSRIVRDLTQLGESVRIEVAKDGVRFAAEGESANGNVFLKPTSGDIRPIKVEKDGEDANSDDEAGSSKAAKKSKVKKEKGDDVDMDDEKDDEDEPEEKDENEESEAEEDSDGGSKKRKKKSAGSDKPAKKARKSKKSDDDDGEFNEVKIAMNSHVALTFSLKYLVNFSKSQSLSKKVALKMSNDVPLLVAYDFGQGEINYYLAPKIGDE